MIRVAASAEAMAMDRIGVFLCCRAYFTPSLGDTAVVAGKSIGAIFMAIRPIVTTRAMNAATLLVGNMLPGAAAGTARAEVVEAEMPTAGQTTSTCHNHRRMSAHLSFRGRFPEPGSHLSTAKEPRELIYPDLSFPSSGLGTPVVATQAG